jgi:aminoglycoside N3'-acetyltransferase
LGDIFGGQTIFYELISFHLIETILNVYEETIKEHTIISLNEFFLNHFKELISSAIKFKSVYQVFRQNFRK